jgi:hypothetical protein
MEPEGVRAAIGTLVDKVKSFVLRYVRGRARTDVQHASLAVPGKPRESDIDYVPTAHLW